MRYKDFTFPHEPERLEIRVRNRLGLAHCPGYGPAIQELGVGERVFYSHLCTGPNRRELVSQEC